MIQINGFKKCNYAEFQVIFYRAFCDSGKTSPQIAAELKLRTEQTINNSFNPNMQKVSDGVLTNVMDSVGLKGFVHWESGERFYYIKNGK